jgi:hypothetical protein
MHPLGFPLCIGNERLLDLPNLSIVESVQRLQHSPHPLTKREVREIEEEADELILSHKKILVCGFHNRAHQIAACSSLKWGNPMVLVANYDARITMPENRWGELALPFEAGRCWSRVFDPESTLILSANLGSRTANEPGARVIAVIDRTVSSIAGPCAHRLSQVA